MTNRKTLICALLTLIFFGNIELNAQGGIKFVELAKKIEGYFDEALIQDVKNQLPQGSDYTIWGWDVGDFSGDGFMDLAISVKIAAEKKKQTQVFLFVDIDGFLTKVAQFPYRYIEMPLEIGVNIKYGECCVTKKNKQFDWDIIAYKYSSGVLMLSHEFSTERIENLTHENFTNYFTLQNKERFIRTVKGEEKSSSNYLTIPSYERGRLIYKGFTSSAYTNYIDYVFKGAFWWEGEEDCSFSISSAYDQQYLYLTYDVTDDYVVAQSCDNCPSDYVEFWLDVNPPENYEASIRKKEKIKHVAPTAEKGIFCFRVSLGDFEKTKAYVKEVSTTDKLYKFQKEAADWIKAYAMLKSDGKGYVVKCRIPFIMLGYDGPPLEEKTMTRLGSTAIVHDFDNEYRPEEETQIATSAFVADNPQTYGALLFVPNDMWYGDVINVYKDDIMKCLVELGF